MGRSTWIPDYGKDDAPHLTCPNVTEAIQLDRLKLIPKPCVVGSSPTGGAPTSSQMASVDLHTWVRGLGRSAHLRSLSFGEDASHRRVISR